MIETRGTTRTASPWIASLALMAGVVFLTAFTLAQTRHRNGADDPSLTLDLTGAVRELQLAHLADMPQFVRDGPIEAQEAYRFAAVNQELLTHIPCFCGCVYIEHKNNRDCYIQEVLADGSIVFSEHAVY